MQYSTRSLAACLLAIYTHEAHARPQGFPAQSSSVEVGVTSEVPVIPIETSAVSVSVAPEITTSSEVLARSQENTHSWQSDATSSASETASEIAASRLQPLPGLQTDEASPIVPLPGLASDEPPAPVETAIAGGAFVSVGETAGATSEIAAPAETSVSLEPLPGLASSVC